jgi:hypothetical protein
MLPLLLALFTAQPADWTKAHLEGPMSAAETRAFMKELGQYVFEHHLKRGEGSPQRGMVYEYFWVRRGGQVDQYVEGEALDTMHDGAWLAASLATAFRATGDEFYKRFLVDWQLPFYLKMLNHSDQLFSARVSNARPDAKPWGKEWALQEGERGFVPYFWDDGGSVSLDRRMSKSPLAALPCVDRLAGRPNPDYRLDGYSLGSSNHMAQDLGVMVQQAWLLLRRSSNPAEQKLAAELADAARNLHACRLRHFGPIPMCVAPAALASGDARLMRGVPGPEKYWEPAGHYLRGLGDFRPGQRESFPNFSDDQEYLYYFSIARAGGQVPPAVAFRTIYDAYTVPLAWRYYCDDAPPPAGVNCFDLAPMQFLDGKPIDYRSDRRGPFRGPRPMGSRLGPQNMLCCGLALQILRSQPDVWETRYRRDFATDLRVYIDDPPPGSRIAPIKPAPVELAGAKLSLVSTRLELRVEGTFAGPALELRFFSRPDAQGTRAVVRVAGQGGVEARNDRLVVHAETRREGQRTWFTLRIPYTVAKGQKSWMTGLEHRRYSLAVGNARRNFYLASHAGQVESALTHELGAGLKTWCAIFHHYGYIPTGIGTHSLPIGPGVRWDDFSDTGGYAHLIGAGAQWLLCLDGKRDWELQGVPQVGL